MEFFKFVKEYWSQLTIIGAFFLIVGTAIMEWRVTVGVKEHLASVEVQERLSKLIDDKIEAADIGPKIIIMDTERLMNTLGVAENKDDIEDNRDNVSKAIDYLLGLE